MSALQDAGPDDAEVGKPDNLVKQGYLLGVIVMIVVEEVIAVLG